MAIAWTLWDWGLLAVVTAMTTAIAWIRDPAWKAFVLALPFPFTLATLSLGGEVWPSQFGGLILLLGYMHAVRLLISRARWPAAAAIAICALAYSGIAAMVNRWIPTTDRVFWIACGLAAIVGLAAFLLFPVPEEPSHRTSLPFWIKVPIIVGVVLFLVLIRKAIGGFMATFPMVSVVGVYESRRSLATTCRQTAWLVFGMAFMIAAIRGVQKSGLGEGPMGRGFSFLVGWTVYLGLLAAATRGRWVFGRAGLVFLILGAGSRGQAAELPPLHFDGVGRLEGAVWEGAFLPIRSEIRAAGPFWSETVGVGPATVSNLTWGVDSNGVAEWSGEWRLGSSGGLVFTQRVEAIASGARMVLTVGARSEIAVEGIFCYLFLPVSLFSEEEVVFWRGPKALARTILPDQARSFDEPQIQIADGADRVVLRRGACEFELRLDRPKTVTLQDERPWGAADYALFWPIFRGPRLTPGQSVRFTCDIRLQGRPTVEPLRLTVRAAGSSDRFEGFGGNFVYGLEGPMATALVERLEPVRARLEMALHEWEPENDNDSPEEANWAYYEARDAEGTSLRRSFDLAAFLNRRRVPIALAIWDLPEWMYEGPPRGRWVGRRTIAPAQWPELLESIGTYLKYMRTRYGVEPDLLSFNEPDLGVRILFSSEGHAEAIRRIGAYLAAQGLRIRLVLGDTASPRETASYGVYAVSDPTARRHVGAVSFHSWGGGTPDDFLSWQTLARRVNAPLMVMEAGLDPEAWRMPAILETPLYAIREAAHYLQILQHARPQSMLIWEYSDDYPLLRSVREEGGTIRLEETVRYRFLEQLVRETPRPAQILDVASGRSDAAAAFRGQGPESRPCWVLHTINHSAARPLEIRGAPAGWSYRAIIREVSGAIHRVTVEEAEGTLSLRMPAWSLVTVRGEPP